MTSRAPRGSGPPAAGPARDLGGSVGIAPLRTFLVWREHFPFEAISRRLTRNDPGLADWLQGTARRMPAQAGDIADATRMATAQLQAVVRREAHVMTYSDCFYLVGAALLLSLVPVLSMGRPGKGKARAAH